MELDLRILLIRLPTDAGFAVITVICYSVSCEHARSADPCHPAPVCRGATNGRGGGAVELIPCSTVLFHVIDSDTRVRAVMSAPVRLVDPAYTLREAADVLLTAGIGSVVVDDDERPGILTKTDLVTALRESYDPGATPVTAVMTPDPVTIDVDAPVQAAIDAMDDHGVKRLPVTASGEVVGIVTTTDLVATAAADVGADGSNAVGVFAAAFAAEGRDTYECRGCGERVVAERHPGECAECGQPVRNITVTQE